jgi:hypothetical protein
MALVRKLNARGIKAFRDYWKEIRGGSPAAPPFDLLEDRTCSEGLDVRIDVGHERFSNRLEAARYLSEKLAPIPAASVKHNAELWNWLSLFYFDQLCPQDGKKGRKVRQEYHYILPAVTEAGHSWHYYRHLLVGPYIIYELHKDHAQTLLCGRVDEFGDFNEQLASRQEFVTNRAIVQAVDLLYFDVDRGKPKRGASPNSRKPGTLRRFVDVIQQFDLTYDLYSLNGEQLAELLPAEFKRWREK